MTDGMSETDGEKTNPSRWCAPVSPILDYATPRLAGRASLALPVLIAVAFGDAALWRAEVEWHGWAALIWIGYFHWAVPLGALLYLLWVAIFCELRPRPNRPFFFAALAGFCFLVYKPILWSLQWHYVQGPSAWGFMFLSPVHAFLLRSAVCVAYPAVPCLVWLIARFSHVPVSAGRLLVSLLIWLGAVPLACFVLAITEHIGGSDSIHAIKSGFVIPPLVLGLGMLFCPFGRREESSTTSAAA